MYIHIHFVQAFYVITLKFCALLRIANICIYIYNMKYEEVLLKEKEVRNLETKFSKSDIVYGYIRDKNGSIQGGYRPMYIIQNDIGNKYSPTITVLPMTSKIKYIDQPTHTLIVANKENGLDKDSMILAEQITTINKTDVAKIVGKITDRNTQKKIFKCFINLAAYGFGDKDAEEIMY